MPRLEMPQGALAFDVHGSGPPLVMLRGLGRSVRHWLGYERLLARHFQVITIDLRGIGKSTVDLSWQATAFDLADDVIRVLDHLGTASAHILGVSLGGMVALAAGIKYPKRCTSLIVINTSIGGFKRPRISHRALASLAKAALGQGEGFHSNLVDVLVGEKCPPDLRAEVAKQYHQLAAEDGLFALTVVKQLLLALRFLPKEHLKYMQVPTLVVYGTRDRFVPNANSRKIASLLPRAQLCPIEGAGHEVSLDHGDKLAVEVRQWAEKFT